MSVDITNPTTDQIIASALRLPPADRAQIIAAIKRSLIEETISHASTDQSKKAVS